MTDSQNQGCASLIVLLAMVLIMLFTIVDDGGEHARRAIQHQGMTDIRMSSDHAWFACADYETATPFTAVNPQGERVEGVVCCGLWMKACTIRW